MVIINYSKLHAKFRVNTSICGLSGLSFGGLIFSIPSIKVTFHNRFFSQKVMKYTIKFLQISKQYFIPLTIIRLYICFIFGLRSLFIKESPYTFPLIALFLEVMYYTSIIKLPHQSLYLITGFSLISYDNLCSLLSKIFEENHELALIYLVVPFSNKPLRRFISIKTFFFGNSAMSSTGRASIIVGATVLGGTLFNSYLDRRAANNRAESDRQAANAQAELNRQASNAQAELNRQAANVQAELNRKVDIENQAKTRAYQNYQDARQEYNKMPFYKKKGEKPQWDEAEWHEWSKTK